MNKLIYTLLCLPLMGFAYESNTSCSSNQCTMMQDSKDHSAANPSSMNPTIVAQPMAMDDKSMHKSELVSHIKDKLKGGWFGKSFEAVEVTEENGIVTITGVVTSEQDKQDVEKQVKEVPNVKEVNNQLQVNPSATVAKPSRMM